MDGDSPHVDQDNPVPAHKDDGFFSRLRVMFSKRKRNEDIAMAIENGHHGAARNLTRARREMIRRVVAFDEKRVADVMAPRADIVAVEIETPLSELVKVFSQAGHSRLPIYRKDLDAPVGVVHIKDVVALLADEAGLKPVGVPTLKAIRREILYVPPSMRVTDLLLRMQASRIHMALVIDEYGGTDGLATIEDLIEEIVGDINDEHDAGDAPMIIVHPGGGWEADARVELEDFADAAGVRLAADDDEADTLGGLVVSLAGRVPQRGEVISHPSGMDFEVTEADARKIRKLRIRRSNATSNEAAE